jgi:catechol 2,3-dioxygenase-like lactoylglutathione lyase family enzyme
VSGPENDTASFVPVTDWVPLVPELMVTDLPRSLDVYTRLFGFTLNYTRPGFACLSLGRAQWMLEQARPGNAWETGPLEIPFGRGINFQIQTPELDALLARLEAAGYPLRAPLQTSGYREGDTEHVQRGFLVQDPDGSLLRFVG